MITKRHGTTTLFAAFNISERQGHRQLPATPSWQGVHQIPQSTGKRSATGLDIHLILDHYSTHQSAEVQRWLKPKKRSRFHFHFTPTSSSWLNQVERWFGLITDKMIRRGPFPSVPELEHAIYAWLASWNDTPKAFVWKATADVILDKVSRCKELAGTAH